MGDGLGGGWRGAMDGGRGGRGCYSTGNIRQDGDKTGARAGLLNTSLCNNRGYVLDSNKKPPARARHVRVVAVPRMCQNWWLTSLEKLLLTRHETRPFILKYFTAKDVCAMGQNLSPVEFQDTFMSKRCRNGKLN